MLKDLKKYIIEQEIDEQTKLVRSVFAKTRDEETLQYFVDCTRQRVWECQERAQKILYSPSYDYILKDDVFTGGSIESWWEPYSVASPNLFMLLYLYCFFRKDEIFVEFISGTTVDCCDEILSLSRGERILSQGKYFQNTIKTLDRDFTSHYNLGNNEYLMSKFCELNEETGEIDLDTFECESFGFILMISLVNHKKIKLFQEIMSEFGFSVLNTEAYTFELELYDDYTTLPDIDYSIQLLSNMVDVRNIDYIADAAIPYSNENTDYLTNNCIDGLLGYRYSSKEILL